MSSTTAASETSPDLLLIETPAPKSQSSTPKISANRARNTAKKKLQTSTHVAEVLLAPIRASLEMFGSYPAATDNEGFALTAINPLHILLALEATPASLAMLDIVGRWIKNSRQFLLKHVRAVLIRDNITPSDEANLATLLSHATDLGIDCDVLSVYVNPQTHRLNETLRSARSRALIRVAKKHGDDVVVAAHTEDEHIERFLNAWLSGLGPEGIAPFVTPVSASTERPIPILTPWAETNKSVIERYLKSRRLSRLMSNERESELAREVMPIFEAMRPGFRLAAARSVRLTEEALTVLREVSQEDLDNVLNSQARSIQIAALLKLAPVRQAWVLRTWLEREGVAVPPRAKLDVLLKNLRESTSGTAFTLRLKDHEIQRWGNTLVLAPRTPRINTAIAGITLNITGPCVVSLPQWHGELRFTLAKADESGIALERLRSGHVEVRPRQGGEKLKLEPLKPSANLKDLYNQAGIDEALRASLPLLWLDGELIFAAGLGLEIRAIDDEVLNPERLRIEFVADSGLWSALA